MANIFKGLNKVDMNSLVAAVALYRPGPMENIPSYQARANGEEQFEYISPEFEQFTAETFGILVLICRLYKKLYMLSSSKIGKS